MSYSQNAEEEFILDYFRDQLVGKFMDIGAFHVFQLSNVRALYEKGWGGYLVEPQPVNYNAIAEHYKDEPRIKVFNLAVGETNGEVDFYESGGDAVGTTDEGHMKRWGNAGVKFSKIKVQQVAVADFMKNYYKGVDFLSIDTESTNIQVFRSIPDFVFEEIKLICIEHDLHQEEIEEKLSQFGFFTLYINGENLLAGK